jgi:hypothetical protein
MSERNAPTDPQTPDAVVTDPEDFNRQQRFKEIHDARQRVTEFLSQMEMPNKGGGRYHLREATRLSYLVSLYIMELEPLIVQSDIDDSRLVPDKLACDSLLQFANSMGVKPGEDQYEQTPSPQEVMLYFSAANRFFAQVGMDLELTEDKGDAGFDYSDILEEGPPGGDAPQLETDGSDEEGDSDE